jgi:nucleoside-diphosphate-sugar epimerase
MNILITGAGLIGTNAARHAVDAGHKVVLVDLSPNRDYIAQVVGPDRVVAAAADIRDLPALLAHLERNDIDTIVHTAGLIGSRVQENSYTGVTNNILSTVNVLEACRLRQLRRIVYVSTFGVYDRAKIADSAIKETHPMGAHNLYGTTKICSEHLLHAYVGMYQLDAVILRPAGVFGRGFYVGGSTVGRMMRDLAASIVKGGTVVIDAKSYGPNEYVYGKDVGHAVFLACQAESLKQRVYNIGTGVVTGPDGLAQTVKELSPASEVKVTGERTAETSRMIPMDIGVSRVELGYAPKFPLKEALRDYMEDLWGEGVRG